MPKSRTFEILSPLKGLEIVSKPIHDPDILDFENANPLEAGEWLILNSAGEAVRSTANPSVAEAGPYVVWAEKGRSDTQMARKVPLIMGGSFRARTKIFEGTPALGASLEVADVTYGGLTKQGLQTYTAGTIVAKVLKTKDADGWLEIQYNAS